MSKSNVMLMNVVSTDYYYQNNLNDFYSIKNDDLNSLVSLSISFPREIDEYTYVFVANDFNIKQVGLNELKKIPLAIDNSKDEEYYTDENNHIKYFKTTTLNIVESIREIYIKNINQSLDDLKIYTLNNSVYDLMMINKLLEMGYKYDCEEAEKQCIINHYSKIYSNIYSLAVFIMAREGLSNPDILKQQLMTSDLYEISIKAISSN